MITIRLERSTDIAAREAVLDAAYGAERFIKPSERLRAGRLPADGLALVAVDGGRVVGTVQLWNVTAGAAGPALLLGPLAVEPEHQGRGVGGKLMARALREARRLGHRIVLLVGDAAYYGRFGFSAARTGALRITGLADRHRLLGVELIAGALAGASGLIRASGDKVPNGLPDFIVAPAYARRDLLRAA